MRAEVTCPNCEHKLITNIPDSRIENFIEKCRKCDKTVKWIIIKI
jgi:ribosomal protein L37AE/L43A